MNMISKQECCGCTACVHICPVHCISMEEDDEGFLYPVIVENDCIHCHQCEAVCPMPKPQPSGGDAETYIAYLKDGELRRQSSSGGVFSAAADWVLGQGGVVFGAAFDENYEVHHIAVESEAELRRLRGSKYVQSRMENAYPAVKGYLESGRVVLFTGTACQIAGLKCYLRGDDDGLYTIDVLCHGVPSPKIWRMHLAAKQAQYGASIAHIEFRTKEKGWKHWHTRITFSNAQQYTSPHGQDPFLRMFLANLTLRPSCHDCPFKGIPRASDISIGDCWGVEQHTPEMDDDKGTSVVLVHSARGKGLFEAIRGELVVRESTLDTALPPTADARRSVEAHPNRKRFWAGVQRGEDFDTLYGYVQKSFLQKGMGVLRRVAKRALQKNGR